MRRSFGLIILVGAGMGMATIGHASTTYTWDFATSTFSGDLGGATYSFLDTSSTYLLPVHGYTTANNPASSLLGSTWATGTTADGALHSKYASSLTDDETGLGFVSSIDGENEIVEKSFVQLDLNNLETAKLINPTIMIGSIQQGEGYYLWASNTAGVPGILVNTYINSSGATGADLHSVQLPNYPTYRYYSVSATSGNVLIADGFIAGTPEPGSLALLA